MDKNKKITDSQSKDIIVKATNVYKIYDEGRPNEVRAIDGANLDVMRGEIVTIMGPSGSGKTTLLNCLSGIDEATSGDILIDGQNIQKMSDNKKTKYRAKRMGFIFQTFNLIPVLTALENVQIPLLVSGVNGKKSKEQAMAMLELVGLADRGDHRPNELSGGQQQRVAVARALVHNPAVVWADEPTGNLDRKTAFEVFDLMLKLNDEKNITFVMVSHDPELAQKTQRVINIESGKIV